MTIVNSRRLTTVALTFAALLACLGAEASELVYTPVNPSFGGNPLNGSILLNEAQARNRTKEPAAVSASTPGSQSPLQQFNHMLERSVLSRLRQRTPKQRWADFSAHLFCPFRLYYLPEGPMIADANLQVWPDVQAHAGKTVLVPYVKSVTELQLNYRVDVIQSGAAGTSRVSQQGRVVAPAAQPTALGRRALGRQKDATCGGELTLRQTDRQLGSYRFDCPR